MIRICPTPILAALPTQPRPWARDARVDVIDGNVLHDGQSLPAWASEVADRTSSGAMPGALLLYCSVARRERPDVELLVLMPIVGRRYNTAVYVLTELHDRTVPLDMTVLDPAHLDEEARVRRVLRNALRG